MIEHNMGVDGGPAKISAWSVWCVWHRNALVWRKLAIPSLLGNVADPVMALMAFGLGLGAMIPDIGGKPYLHYLAVGAVCVSAMNAATFEALYSAFSRMHVQKTWDSLMNTPVRLHEIVLGEWLWAASKSALASGCMMLVVLVLGIQPWWFVLLGWPVLWLAGLLFAGLGLCVNARAPGYDFFMFYFTLAVTPMTFLSGAFFPRENLPDWLAVVAAVLPLSVVVDALRALANQDWQALALPMVVMTLYAALAGFAAVWMTQRRFNKRA